MTQRKRMGKRMSMAIGACAAAYALAAAHALAAVEPLPAAKDWTDRTATRDVVSLNGWWHCALTSAFGPCPAPSSNVWEVASLPEYRREARENCAWYRREVTVPDGWRDRRVVIDFSSVQTVVRVFVDGKESGHALFPCGEAEVPELAAPGRHDIALFCEARPLSDEDVKYWDADRVDVSKATVTRKWLPGNVVLKALPKGVRLTGTAIATSVKRKTIGFTCEGEGLDAGKSYRVVARVAKVPGFAGFGGAGSRTFRSGLLRPERARYDFPARSFKGVDDNGQAVDHSIRAFSIEADSLRVSFEADWPDPDLWDVDTPQNLYYAEVELQDEDGRTLDVQEKEVFGFREFEIVGKDFFLNGSRIHLRVIVLAGQQVGNGEDGCYETCFRSFLRCRDFGFNSAIGRYDATPGSYAYDDDFVNAADDAGMIISFTLPSTSEWWPVWERDNMRRWAAMAARFMRRYRNHPAIVMWSLNPNVMAYRGDQNPLKIDHTDDYRVTHGYWKNRPLARDAGRHSRLMVRYLDPTRPAYHHSSGNLDDMWTGNIYLNFAPVQERSDWFRHWSEVSEKPAFLVEYGVPSVLNFHTFRWDTKNAWSNALHNAQAEYSAEFVGERAFRLTDTQKRLIDHDRATHVKYGNDSVHGRDFSVSPENYDGVVAKYLSRNFRDFRGWGVSAILPWEAESGGTLRPEFRHVIEQVKPPQDAHPLHCAWAMPGMRSSQRSTGQLRFLHGPCLDLVDRRWAINDVGRAYLRWNREVCSWIAGPVRDFTAQDHVFTAGERFEKSVAIVNDTRRPAEFSWRWRVKGGGALGFDASDSGTARIGVGEKAMIPIRLKARRPGAYEIELTVTGAGFEQRDSFAYSVRPCARAPEVVRRVALYDPKGLTAQTLERLGIAYEKVETGASLKAGDLLVIGREALTTNGLGWASSLAKGVDVVVFEQTRAVLQDLLGFRVQERGMREWFVRTPDDPLLVGLTDADFRDWRGAATLLPPYMDLPRYEQDDPRVDWCGFQNTRVWRAECRGSVSSEMVEKPQKGDWLALLDGGFALQYSPLLRNRQADRVITFCLLDVSGRTVADPIGDEIVRRLVGATPERKVWPGELRLAVRTGHTVTNYPSYIEGRLPEEFLGLSNADWAWHAQFAYDVAPDGRGSDALRVVDEGGRRIVCLQVPPEAIDCSNPTNDYLRTTKRGAWRTAERLRANLGLPVAPAPVLERMSAPTGKAWLKSYYHDVPIHADDPYRYGRW